VYSIEYVTDLAQTNDWRSLVFLQLPTTNFLWTDTSAPAAGRRFYRAVVFAMPTNFVFIPPGTFRMGSPTNELDRSADEGPQTVVTISRGFWMGKYLVTQGDYLALVGNNPSVWPGDSNRPVESVSWGNATNYCALLTARDLAAQRIPSNCVYRLPTEAEWEYACRAWTSDRRFYFGDDLAYTNLTNHAWYFGNNLGPTQPVGQKLPNPWGLYDMGGNAWEWCSDFYGPYLGGSVIDPQGPTVGLFHVVRGGGFNSQASDCRSARRREASHRPGSDYLDFGFRVVLAQDG
jgi:formylglycine-generating enzyme required for sulfatase activity